MSESIQQVEDTLKLMAELGIPDNSNKTEFLSNSNDYAGITPYNPVPKDFCKIGDYAQEKVYRFFLPYSKASTPEEEKASKNVLTPFFDEELDRECVPTSIKGYVVEYNNVPEWSEYYDGKFTNYCKVIGQKEEDFVTNEPVINPIKWMYKSGSTSNHRVPSQSLIQSNSVGSNGMLCSECIKQGCNQGPDSKGKHTWCKERGLLVLYITHLGTINKKNQVVVYTPVSDIHFASSWDLANGKTTPITQDFIPCYMNLSGSYLAGSFADPTKGLEAIDGFGTFFEKVRKASPHFFNIVQWKLNIDIVVTKAAIASLSFTSDGSYESKELAAIIKHWKANKPEFNKQQVPFNKFTTELRGTSYTPQENLEAVKEQINLDKF